MLPDGKRIISAGVDGTLRVWDAATGYETLSLKSGWYGGPGSVAVSPDGKRIFGAAHSKVNVWNAGLSRKVEEVVQPRKN